MRRRGLLFLSLAVLALAGCSRGAVKGPVGQDDRGIGFKIPVLSLFDRDTYDADNFTPDNIDSEEINPFREDVRDAAPERDSFTRYREYNDY